MRNFIVLSVSIFVLFLSNNVDASTKGCVDVFEDGSESCGVQTLGTSCDTPRRGSTETVNGKKVIKRYQIQRCPNVDGLGRSTSQASQQSASNCSCRNASGVVLACTSVPAGQCNQYCQSNGASFGTDGCEENFGFSVRR